MTEVVLQGFNSVLTMLDKAGGGAEPSYESGGNDFGSSGPAPRERKPAMAGAGGGARADMDDDTRSEGAARRTIRVCETRDAVWPCDAGPRGWQLTSHDRHRVRVRAEVRAHPGRVGAVWNRAGHRVLHVDGEPHRRPGDIAATAALSSSPTRSSRRGCDRAAISGALLAWSIGYSLLDSWILAALVLYMVVGLCWLPVVVIQIRLRDLARGAAKIGDATRMNISASMRSGLARLAGLHRRHSHLRAHDLEAGLCGRIAQSIRRRLRFQWMTCRSCALLRSVLDQILFLFPARHSRRPAS